MSTFSKNDHPKINQTTLNDTPQPEKFKDVSGSFLLFVPVGRIIGTDIKNKRKEQIIVPKTRINVSLDQDLAEFAKIFAAENRTSVADMVTQYLLALKRRIDGEHTEQILAHPAFQMAVEEARDKLRSGTAQWHSYEEVFGD